ncbi:hypothetical protein BT96DRAFT_573175 [Gymnopus androsaceus JB14]|uniref:Uncharacterized protein n=1 Tax=Gymnopus androsaceus JB14 TaxID=1447944 RepID=A0A6A4HVK3_9AGAR|nr:hypothetical protein BT96DRAFT_573175 [Gymnopus androsaceus JB14]
MLGNIVVNLVSTGFQAQQMTLTNPLSLNFASLFISLGVNVIATMLIGLKLWNHYHATRSYISYKRLPTIRIMLLLIESGALFAIAQVSNLPALSLLISLIFDF